ncbi:MAG: hypothetical protein AAB396_00885 [Patescibacteria group bacterium]
MNKNINLAISTIIIIFSVLIGYALVVSAQSLEINYPIKELGNCGNETECKVFCDKSENMAPCVNFAERNGLISPEEAKMAKAFIQASMKGPGGCNNKEECEIYCDNSNNLEVCLDFAKKNNLMSDDELEEAEKVSKVLKEGAQLPGGCKNKKECEIYCDNSDNIEECIAFAEKSGVISSDELIEAKKAVKAIKSGIRSPGDCRGRKECDIYCSSPGNMEECIVFAEAAGFIPPEEAEMARKMMPLMQAGKMPGGCRGKKECEAYCFDESHIEECANFALGAGLMKQEEFEMFKKTGGKGPGDCRGKEQCETFCNNPENQEVCFNFAKEHNLIPQEEIEKMKGGMDQIKKGFGMAPPEVSQCLKSIVGEEVLNKVQSGQTMPSQQLGEQMRKCFEQFMPQGQGGSMGPEGKFDERDRRMGHSQNMPIEGGFMGPGGCQNQEECQKYCSENPNECAGFKKPEFPIENRESEKFREFNKEDFEGNIPKEIKEMREKFPEGAPDQEMIQKMMQGKNFPQEFQKREIPQQYIPEQYQEMIKQYQQYPNQIPPKEQAQFPQGTQQMQPIMPPQYQPQPAPIQEQIPPSSGILSPLSNFGASIFQLLMGL